MFRNQSIEALKHPDKTESFIRECGEISELLQHCSRDALMALDLDNSTLRPTRVEDLGSDQWFREVLGHLQKVTSDPSEAVLSAVKLNNTVLPHIQVKSVEPETAHVIDALKKMVFAVIAVTARRHDTADATARQLNDINVHFTDFGNEVVLNLPSYPNKHIIFKYGVLYCDGANKGECILALLNIINKAVRKIVMLDDSEKNLQQAHDVMMRQRISFIGLRYNVLDQRAANHEFKRANAKLSEVSSLFSRSVTNIIAKLPPADQAKNEELPSPHIH